MKLSMDGLRGALLTSVVELVFVRRNPKPGWSNVRRMLCTNNREILTSLAGKVALKFDPPTQSPKYNASAHKLVTAWDILWQEYRQINIESCEVLSAMPVSNKQELDNFWIYFNEVLQKMTPDMKIKFMNNRP